MKQAETMLQTGKSVEIVRNARAILCRIVTDRRLN